jgi:hypothetical protein
MNTIAADTNTDYRSEYSASVGERDIYVTVKRYAARSGFNAGQIWVTVEEHIYEPSARAGWDKFLFDCHLCEAENDLDAIRHAFIEQRGRLKGLVRNWNQYKYWASLEKGGKRAYYTRHANEYKARIPAAAAQWKLCKQIWKQITKL